MSTTRRDISRGLASALLAGEWRRGEMLFRAADALGGSGLWLRQLVHDVLLGFPRAPHDARDALARFISEHEAFTQVWEREWIARRLRRWYLDAPAMREHRWPVRRLETLADVEAWLGVDGGQLDGLADRKGWERRTREPRLQNYRYLWVPKRSGGVRLLEAPKSRLKALQRRILEDILEAIPAHPGVQGFQRGRSALTHARVHAGRRVVLRFDLRAFFAEVHPARAFGVLRAAGYPEEVTRTLMGLCTNQVPTEVLARAPRPVDGAGLEALILLRRRLSAPHLPQGAPTSPALANLCAFQLDVRLTQLAHSLGASYSRYADDLTFSGDEALEGAALRLPRLVGRIVREEGFSLNPHKTRIMRAATRQSVTGLVVNREPHVARAQFDALKATLHNCVRSGPTSQARGIPAFREHLQGRIAWVEQAHPRRGAALRQLFQQIVWG